MTRAIVSRDECVCSVYIYVCVPLILNPGHNLTVYLFHSEIVQPNQSVMYFCTYRHI